MSNSISVVVPCYNGEKDLPRCVDSLLAQTMAVDIVIVDDGSTDGTGIIADGYAARNANVTVIHKANQGLPQARRSGLEVCKGEYVGFVDSDDWVDPVFCETLYKALCSSEADIACGSVFMDYEDGRQKTIGQRDGGKTLTSQEALRHLHCRTAVFPYMWNKLYRRGVFEGVVFPEGNFIGEDYVTTVQILENAGRVAVVDIPMSHYWQSLSSMSRGEFRPVHRLSYQNYKRASKQLIARHPELADAIHGYIMVEYMSFVVAMSRNGAYDRDMLREIRRYVRSHLLGLLRTKEVSVMYKCCAILMSVSDRLMTTAYRFVPK